MEAKTCRGQILIEFLVTFLLMMSFLTIGYHMQLTAFKEVQKKRLQPQHKTSNPFYIERKKL